VCYTLWRNHTKPEITLEDYSRLGKRTSSLPIAQQILYRRVEDELKEIDNEQDLLLVARLLPALCTQERTKQLWELGPLAEYLGAAPERIERLLPRLHSAGIVRTTPRDTQVRIELAHDYLVEGLSRLARRVELIWPRKALTSALQRYISKQQLATPSDLDVITARAGDLEMDPKESEFLFRSSLELGIETRRWFDVALSQGIDTWKILTDRVEIEDPPAYFAVQLLGRLKDDDNALKLLERLLPRADLASTAIEALGDMQTVRALDVLEQVLSIPRWRPNLRVVFDRLARSNDETIAVRARKLLSRSDEPQTRPPSRTARRFAGDWESRRFARDRESHPSPVDSQLSVPYSMIEKLLSAGRFIPFLGGGISHSFRTAGTAGRTDASLGLPDGAQLGRYLAERSGFPTFDDGDSDDLSRVASYLRAQENDRTPLYKLLRSTYEREYPMTPLHKYLATVPAPLLIVTTNYDDLLERAFVEQGRRFEVVVVSPTAGKELENSLMCYSNSGEPRFISPDQMVTDPESTAVIYKILGSFNRGSPKFDNYVITEEDHLELAFRLGTHRGFPTQFARYFRTRPFLFLGYSVGHWTRRMLITLLRDVSKSTEVHRSSLSIQLHPSEFERGFWGGHGVKVFDVPVDEFVRSLQGFEDSISDLL
jgi:SIR2-like domain